MSEWKTVPLAMLADWYSGGTPKTSVAEYWGGEIPWISAASLQNFFITTSDRNLTALGATNGTRLVPPGTTIFVVRGMSLMSEFRIGITTREVAFGQDCKALIPRDGVDPYFLAYAIRAKTSQILDLVDSAGHGTGRLQTDRISALEVPVPQDLHTQQAVIAPLKALDDKIAVNDRIEATYEQIFRLSFQELAIDSEPESGKQISAQDLVEFNPRLPAPAGDEAVYLDMAALPTTTARVRQWSRRPPKSGTRFANGDTVMARITPCLENGKTAFIDFLDTHEVGIGSTEFIVMRARPGLPVHLPYFLARSPRFRQEAIRNMAGSSGRQRVSASQLLNFPLNRPEPNKLARFGEAVAKAFDHMRSLGAESAALAELRDTLLPKLMSGEIRVRDAEKVVEDAV